MDKYLDVLKNLKIEIEKSLQAEHLVNNRVPQYDKLVEEIKAKKTLQIEALNCVIKNI